MAILDSNEIFYTAFEPVQKNRFIVYIDGFPAWMVKSMGAITGKQGTVTLNHINVEHYVKGKTKWDPIDFTLHHPITPQGSTALMEWVRLHHESVTGRDGYSDFYKKDLTLNLLGPSGDVVSEWIIKQAFITSYNFGDFSYDTIDTANEIKFTVQPTYCILNF